MTKTEIKKILEESVVDPKLLGPTRVMLDAPGSYYSYRAVELIEEGLKSSDDFQDKLKKAILFLAVARLKNGAKPKKAKPRKRKITLKNIDPEGLVGPDKTQAG